MKANASSQKRILQHLERLRQIVAQTPSIKKYRSDEELIAAVRKTRQEIWEEKLAARP